MSAEAPKEDYRFYRARMAEKATEFEDFVFDLLRKHGITVTRYVSRKWQYDVGECSGGIEVKFDDRMRETRRVYIEIAEKARPDESRAYVPSGIYRDDNSWLYVIGDYDTVYVFAKSTLKLLHKAGRFPEPYPTPTSKGFVIPMEKAELYAAHVFKPSVMMETTTGENLVT